MKTLQFTKEISASAQKVWQVLWDESTYPLWTNEFNPGGGSLIRSDWQVGGKTFFLDGKGNGMVSTIQSKEEPYEMVFKHLGEITNGVEDTSSDKVKAWAGSLEEYHLSENNGVTTLTASVQTDDAWEKMMTNGFTKGLEEVKKLAEQ